MTSLPDKTAIKLILYSFMLAYMSIYLVVILVDPYQLRQKDSADWAKYKYSRLYSRFQFEDLKHKDYSLIFGSSRSQKISSRLQSDDYLNFHNLYSEPGDVKNFITQLSVNQLQNIDVIYYELDIAAFRRELMKPINYNNNVVTDIVSFSLPLTFEHILSVARELYYNVFDASQYQIDSDGSLFIYNDDAPTFIAENPTRRIFKGNSYSPFAINDIADINKFCIENAIDIIFYTPTYSDKAIREMNWDVIRLALTDLVNQGVKFKNNYFIEGISDIQSNNMYTHFSDASHLNTLAANQVFKNYVVNDGGLLIDDLDQLKISINSLMVR
tara:strand:+ start:14647 stop:15630 length:984 start_codon:yes stop_codon:yes gene_type:complete